MRLELCHAQLYDVAALHPGSALYLSSASSILAGAGSGVTECKGTVGCNAGEATSRV